MIVWLSTNCSVVVFQDMYVDIWAELAPLLWPHNLINYYIGVVVSKRQMFESTTSYISTLNFESIPCHQY